MAQGADRETSNTRVVGLGDFPAYGGLLEHLGIPIHQVAEGPPPGPFMLVESGARLELRPPGELDRPGIVADFPPDQEAQAVAVRGPLSKAFGKRVHTVLDATGGLGADAYRLAAAGYRVRAWERHPALFALAISGWGAAVAAGRVPGALTSQFSMEWGDSSEALMEVGGLDVGVYFDPMYPAPRKAAALPKRPLQVLRQLLGDEPKPVEIVEEAKRQYARVVVKRPHHALPIAGQPDFEVTTKLVRFDVYLNPSRMESAGE